MKSAMINNIEKLINDEKVKDKINKLLNKKYQNNLDCDNLYSCFDLQAKLIILQIFAGKHEIDLAKVNLDELTKDFAGVVVKLILEIYKPKNKDEFLEIACCNYLENGYMCHGTSKKHCDNIKQNGLNGNNNFKNIELLNEINDIFLKHKRKKCFEGKMNLLSSNSYYVSDNIYSGIYYAYQSPEYFSRFCANGHLMKGNDYDRFAYFRRDKRVCKQNLKVFCVNNNFTKYERRKILKCFEILWMQNVDKNEHFYLCLIPRKFLNRIEQNIFKQLREKLNKLTKKDIVNILLRPRYIHDQSFTQISAQDILFIDLLDLHKSFKDSNKGEKFIYKNDKKTVYDLVIDVPYKNKKFFVFGKENDVVLEELEQISSSNEEKIIKKGCFIFANECAANTAYGKKIIDNARKLTSIKEIEVFFIKKAKKDLQRSKILLENDIDKCFKVVYKMMFDYVVVLKAMVDNGDWFSNLDTGSYYTAYGELDLHYMILKAKDSKVYDRELLLSRINNIETFVNKTIKKFKV